MITKATVTWTVNVTLDIPVEMDDQEAKELIYNKAWDEFDNNHGSLPVITRCIERPQLEV